MQVRERMNPNTYAQASLNTKTHIDIYIYSHTFSDRRTPLGKPRYDMQYAVE